MPVAISSLWTQQGVLIGAVCAATILVITPVVLMTFFVQRFLVRSLTFGAVK
jgi:multiple sugar transport system permease protein